MFESTPAVRPSGWIDLPCTCANLRRLARLSTRVYQEELSACGMEVSQLTLLASIRRFPDLTQIQLAQAAGMHRQGIAKLEGGERSPTWDTVQKLAAALGVDCTAFQDAPPRKRSVQASR